VSVLRLKLSTSEDGWRIINVIMLVVLQLGIIFSTVKVLYLYVT
jgi:hypothetical protein